MRRTSSTCRSTAPDVVVIGVGNRSRGDDAAGIAVARLVAASAPPGVDVHECGGEPGVLIDALRGRRAALVIDAARSGAAPGTLHRFDASAGPLPVSLGAASTHGLGVAEAIELARALGCLPERIVVLCVEGQDFGERPRLSPAVAGAIPRAADAVLAELTAAS